MRAFGMTVLIAANFFCCFHAEGAQVNYGLFAGYGIKRGYPPIVNYRAWVISYKGNKYYDCIARYDATVPATPSLDCELGGSFDPPLLTGSDVKTVQALGSPRAGRGTDEAQAGFFWQIDQASGKIQFCIPIQKLNCATFQISE